MLQVFYVSRLFLNWISAVVLAGFLATSAGAAPFEFTALIQVGASGVSDWEIGVGTSSPTDTASLATHWANNADRLFQISYVQPTNTVSVRVYGGTTATGAFTEASFQPAVTATTTATWTLPSGSFFAQALTGPTPTTSITVSNLTLSAGTILQPLGLTTMVASRPASGGTSTVWQSQDVVFLADGSGNWNLQGLVQMKGVNATSGSQLALGVTALASDVVPEPGTFGLLAIGGGLMFGFARGRKGKWMVARST